ncbi:MAG: VWA domain-containing protein [Puniceicoccaceae bacterium]
MSLTFLQPSFLLLLALAVLFPLWRRRSLTDLSRSRLRWSTLLRSAILGLLVLAAADPRLLLERNRSHLVFVADASASMEREALRRIGDWYDLAESTPRSLVLFAGEAETTGRPEDGSPPAPGAIDPSRTRIAHALRFAAATVPSGSAPTLVLLSDGRGLDADPGAIGDDLAAEGVRVHTVPVEPPDRPEILVREVGLPSEAGPGEPIPVEVVVGSRQAATVELALFRNGAASTRRTVELRPGANRFSFVERAAEEGMMEITAEIRPSEGTDTFLDNNRLAAHLRTGDASRILLLSDRPESARYLSRALRQEGFRLDIRPPTGLPATPAGLEDFDLVVFDNIAATGPSADQLSLLRNYVRDFGGGFLMLGGEKSFGLGGYFGTPVDELLPVESDFEKEKETPSLAVVPVIDRSGSMNGEKIEMVKRASEATINLLSARDYAGVVAFDSEAHWISRLESAANGAAMIRRIRQLTAGGGTSISPGLDAAHRALARNPAKIKHVILLTDGQSQPGPFYEQTSRMAREGITVSTVAVGSGADSNLLEQIARWGGGRFHFTADPGKVVQIFARETMTASRSAIEEMPFQPVRARAADFLEGIDFAGAPFLLGFVKTRPKATADLWLATETGAPLLATWRYGLGKAGAFTSDARNRWAVDWLRWHSFGTFWSGVFRHLLREDDLGTIPARFERRGDRVVLEAEALDAQGEFLPEAEATLHLLLPSGERRTLSPDQVAPGTFRAEWPAEAGLHFARLLLSRDGEAVASRTIHHDVGYPAEYALEPADDGFLAALAASTGGAVNPSAEILAANDRTVRAEHELWPWLAAAALFLFLPDVALKRGFPRR